MRRGGPLARNGSLQNGGPGDSFQLRPPPGEEEDASYPEPPIVACAELSVYHGDNGKASGVRIPQPCAIGQVKFVDDETFAAGKSGIPGRVH